MNFDTSFSLLSHKILKTGIDDPFYNSLFTTHYSLFTFHYSLFTFHYSPYHRTKISQTVKIANRIEATPLDVKKAALSREISSGLIIKC